MIVDYRVYLTLYAVSGFIYLSAALFIHGDRDRWFYRLMGTAIGTASIAGFAHFIDWLWS